MAAEEREIKLKVFKTKLTKEEYEQRLKDNPQVQPLTEENGCGNWYIKIAGGHIYTCRMCHTWGPTWYYYEECVQLPD